MGPLYILTCVFALYGTSDIFKSVFALYGTDGHFNMRFFLKWDRRTF